MPFRDINPAPIDALGYGDMVGSIGANVLAGEERGMRDALVMRQLELDAVQRNALAAYLESPEAERGARFNALVGASPQAAADVLAIENAQRERAAAERQRQALDLTECASTSSDRGSRVKSNIALTLSRRHSGAGHT